MKEGTKDYILYNSIYLEGKTVVIENGSVIAGAQSVQEEDGV